MNLLVLIFSFAAFSALAQPAKILLQTPANQATVDRTCTFTWTKSPTATSYEAQIDTNPIFSDPMGHDLSITQFTTSLEKARRYFWKVRGLKNGIAGEWSDIWEFTTLPPEPSAPLILAPLTSRDSFPLSFTVVWDSAAYAESYRIFVIKDGSIIIAADELPGYTYDVVGLDSASTYRLHVQGVNRAGLGTPAVITFTTIGNTSLPLPVKLIYPTDSSTPPIENSMPPFVVTLLWQSQNPIKGYHLQVAADPTFDSIVWNDSTLHATEEYFPVDYRQCYWWRVRARNTAGWGVWSTVWSFCESDQGSVLSSPYEDDALLIPNPATNTVLATFSYSSDATALLNITDAVGRTVYSQDVQVYSGSNSVKIDLSNLPNGVYFLRLSCMQSSLRLVHR